MFEEWDEWTPIPEENWVISGTNNARCSEPCCELRRVKDGGKEVMTEEELLDALQGPEVFWW